MPLTVYLRHSPACPRSGRCRCIYWVRGSLRRRPVRQSLATRNKEVAHRRAAELELGREEALQSMSWPRFADAFLARYPSPNTRRRYAHLLALLAAALPPDVRSASSLDLERFVASRKLSANSARREIASLRTIWSFAVAHHIARENLARRLRVPKEEPVETRPLSDAELDRLEAAIRARPPAVRRRQWAMYQVLRGAGLRVSDLVLLRPDSVDAAGYLSLRTRKTKTAVRLALPAAARDALAALAPLSSGYYFWTGNAFKSCCDSVWRSFAGLGREAAIARCHPHRLRDTFAVNLLRGGADLRLVSKLLGHDSIRTTERHYAPWVEAFQRQADEALRRAETLYANRTADSGAA